MPHSIPAIHQFHAGSAFGDGVTNGLLFTRGLLRELGFSSQIYCAHVAPELADEIASFETYDNRPDQRLLLHHSMGHDLDGWVDGVACPMAMVYHNITPAEFFPPDSPPHLYSRKGRQQLAAWRSRFCAAVGDSPFNARELDAVGYHPVDVLPLLVDLARLRARPVDGALRRRLEEDDAFTLLFVGRIVPNKCQHDLILAVDALRRMLARPVRLVLAGGVSLPEYQAGLEALCAQRGMTECVAFLGKVSDETLGALYAGCDAFLCLSEHEGFGMPLIEAMAFDLPVIAFSAATVKVLAETPALRRHLIRAARSHLARFERPRLLADLADFLETRMGVPVPCRPPEAHVVTGRPWRIEGPFDTSYSLALVNRHLALALAQQGVDARLFATEGPGDYQPDPAFLAGHPEVAALWRDGGADGPADVVLRNLYPPRVTGMGGHTRLLASYGWEESAFPEADVGQFNRHLNLITTVSSYVARVLVDNGVVVPIAVVGNGVDHIARHDPVPPERPLGKGPFRFLHVSSCFPRKGLDVLLEAWGRAFAKGDGVSLVIKTFPNPHNQAARQIAELDRKVPRHAEIVLIEDDLDEARMAGLYQACDAVVMPSRGEGFGLPMAEAMWLERPLITTAYGGQADFCTDQTAWLVDYRFAAAKTHLGLPGSVWVEPDVEDLARILRSVWSAPVAERRRRVEAAKERIRRDYTWAAVAERTRRAIAALDARPVVQPYPTIAWVGPWASAPSDRVDVATRALTAQFPPASLRRFAGEGGYGLCQAITDCGAAIAVLEIADSLGDPLALAGLLDRLHSAGLSTHLLFPAEPRAMAGLEAIRDSLAKVRRLIVADVDGLNRLKDLGLAMSATLLPMRVDGAAGPALSRRLFGLLTAPDVMLPS